jgi:hypothetical protein
VVVVAGTVTTAMAMRNVESRLERLFQGGLSRPFRSTLQPIEIGQRVVREMDLGRRVATSGLMAPNHVKIWLSPVDAERFEGFQKALSTELSETVRQHAVAEGYNFVGPVAVEIFIDDELAGGKIGVKASYVDGASEPRVVTSAGETYVIGTKPLVVGRQSDCDIVISDPNVSRRHAEIWRTAEGVAVRDLQSTNGTIVNGHRVTAVSLTPRDEIEIGPQTMRIELA